MKYTALCMTLAACLFHTTLFSQDETQQQALPLTSKDSIVESAWMIGLGYNFVDDSGDMLDELFSFDEQWNAVPYPSRVSIGRYFKSGIGIEGIVTYNKYKVGKLIDGVTNLEEKDYFGLDARLSYDLNTLIGETAWFDPYVGVGLGYTGTNSQPRGTYNAVIGFRTWFSDRWGLDLNSSGKWSMGNGSATNHLQHAAGVVYRFGIEKDLSEKGAEKLALIEALDAEKQRKQDSIAAAARAREDAALAERLAKEKEAAQLAAAEKAKKDAEDRRKRAIEDEIEALGFVYFDLNSSYLGAKSKDVLDGISLLLKEYEGVTLKVGSHADSRGTSSYNDWLSKQRVERTVAYLVQQGIAPERLVPESYGEEKLRNECDDNTYCPEEKHRMNRRSEFEVLSF
ncbi:MAG TPA: OmpA family protein [Pricia sp.]|nr:OmpA family protein [Pricia sp.]